jgi:hypothetical protein
MFWTLLDSLALWVSPERLIVRLAAWGIWQFARTADSKGFDDPIYKRNLQRLIDRNRQFEEARNERHS